MCKHGLSYGMRTRKGDCCSLTQVTVTTRLVFARQARRDWRVAVTAPRLTPIGLNVILEIFTSLVDHPSNMREVQRALSRELLKCQDDSKRQGVRHLRQACNA